MSQKGLRVALIGVGGHGPLFPKILEHSGRGSKIVALVDSNAVALKNAAQAMGVPDRMCFSSTSDLLECLQYQIDAVIVALPPTVRQPVIDCLKSGLHVFCENPFSLDPEMARQIVDLANARCAVNEQWRYLPTVVEAEHMLADDAIGKLVSIEIGGKGRSAWTEFQRIGTHLLSVVIHKFLAHAHILGCSATAMDATGSFCSFSVRHPEPDHMTAVFDTDAGIPVRAIFDNTGYDVRRSYIELRGTHGRMKLIGGLLEGLWMSETPTDLVDLVGDWCAVAIDGESLWKIQPGDEQRALLDPCMNPTFELWDNFERWILEDAPGLLSPAGDYINIAAACEAMVESVNAGGAIALCKG